LIESATLAAPNGEVLVHADSSADAAPLTVAWLRRGRRLGDEVEHHDRRRDAGLRQR